MDDLVRVFVAGSAAEGQIVKGRLEVEGIPVLIKSEGEGPYRVGPAELFVPASFEPHARLVLESVDEVAGDDAAPEEDPAWEEDPASDDSANGDASRRAPDDESK